MLTNEKMQELFHPLIEAGTTVENFREAYRHALLTEVDRRIDAAEDNAALRDALRQVMSLYETGQPMEQIARALILTLKPPTVEPDPEPDLLTEAMPF